MSALEIVEVGPRDRAVAAGVDEINMGNIATEDLLYALGRSGIGTGIDMDRVLAASAYVEERLGHANPALLGRAGMFPALRSSLVSPARKRR